MSAEIDKQRTFDLQEWRRQLMAKIMRRWQRRCEASLRADGTLDVSQVRSVLICRPNHRLGNMLLLTPLIVELDRLLPHARIDIVAGGNDAPEIFRGFANVQCVHCLSRRMIRHPLVLLRTIRLLRHRHYDLAIDPCEASQSGRALLVLARARQGVALPGAAGENRELRSRLLQEAPRHFAQLPVFLLRNALPDGLVSDTSQYPPLDIALTRADRSAARVMLDKMLAAIPGPATLKLGIFTGATGAKRYEPSWWSQFVKTVRQQQPDWSIVEILPPGNHSTTVADLPHYASSNVRQVAALISCLDAFVCADSGVMHLASASGTPTVGLFSQTDPRKYKPYGNNGCGLVTSGLTAEQVAERVVAAVMASNGPENASNAHDRVEEVIA